MSEPRDGTEDPAPSRLAWLAAAQRDRCLYCRCETWLPWQRRREAGLRARWDIPASRSFACQIAFDYRMATVEHLVPKAAGGDDTPANLAMACAYCNSTRQEASLSDHAARMRKLVVDGQHPCLPGQTDAGDSRRP